MQKVWDGGTLNRPNNARQEPLSDTFSPNAPDSLFGHILKIFELLAKCSCKFVTEKDYMRPHSASFHLDLM